LISQAGQQVAIALVGGWVDQGVLPGASLLVSRRGDLIIERYWGLADSRSGLVVGPQTLWSIASITKPVTAMAVLACVDRGLLSLDGRISELFPEFIQPGDPRPWRNDISLRHLLTHTSGLAGFSRDNLALRRRHAPIDDFIASFLDEEVHFPPGQWHLYSSVGYGLAAQAVGRALRSTVFHEEGDRPLQSYERFTLSLLKSVGAIDAIFRPGDSETARIAWVESTGQEGLDWEIGNSRYYRSLGMPWGGLFARSRDVLAFIESFLPIKSHGAQQVISATARREMVREQVAVPEAPVTLAASQRDVTWDPTRSARSKVTWGLGWEVKGSEPSDYFGEYAHASTFGHYGASGTIAWADPEAELVMVLLTNRAWVSRWPTTERRAARLANALMAALD
jgi:CubicO group peptidase (beta-lactamase class C family)